MKHGIFTFLAASAALMAARPAFAATYSVGPTRTYKSLGDVATKLAPGDVVLIDGGTTYPSVWLTASGTQAAPITVRGVKASGKRPVFSGGDNTIHAQADYLVFESIELTAGAERCFFHHGHAIVLRDVIVHDCPKHGILGADNDSGSLTLEYSEVMKTGYSDQKHQIYMSTDQVNHPGSVFRMQFNYVHDSNSGIGVKSRAERNEIYYNWFEGNTYYDVDLIGSQEYDEPFKREDSDVVGNVFVRTNEQSAARLGGDGSGESYGRYRFVGNTFLTKQVQWGSPVIRLRDGIDSVEMHNNAFFSTTSVPADIFRDVDAVWRFGRATFGSNNWVQAGSTMVPSEWTATKQGADPGFTDRAGFNLVPTAVSPLVNAGGPAMTPSAHPFPQPLAVLAFVARRGITAPGGALPRVVVGSVDVGAFESGSSSGSATSSSSTSSSVSSSVSTGSGSSSSTGAGGGTPATEDPNKLYYWPIAGLTLTLAGFMAWLGKRLLFKK